MAEQTIYTCDCCNAVVEETYGGGEEPIRHFPVSASIICTTVNQGPYQ